MTYSVLPTLRTVPGHHCASTAAPSGAPWPSQPVMASVLADLAVESEAARAYDRAAGDEHEALLRRLATAVAKYWLCKRHPPLAAEALECLGGNGYVEESMMPRPFRESPLNGIWEGSGTSSAWTFCGRWPANRSRSKPSSPKWPGHPADHRLDEAADDLSCQLARPGDLEAGAPGVWDPSRPGLDRTAIVAWATPKLG